MKQPNYGRYFKDDNLVAQFAKAGNQANVEDPLVLAKVVRGNAAWYIYSFDAETGLCDTFYIWFDRQWSAGLSVQDMFMQNAVRDKSFKPCRLSDIQSGKIR